MRFVLIPDLCPGMEVAVTITNTLGYVILREGTILTDTMIRQLNDKGYQGTYVREDWTASLGSGVELASWKFAAGANVVRDRDVIGMKEIAREIAETVVKRQNRRIEILNIQSYEEYDFGHAVDVAIYSVAIGQQLGYPLDDLILLAQAGILHDLGMSVVPDEIINKKGGLTDAEYARIKEHPKRGVEMDAMKDISRFVKQAIAAHHENVNGTGYPNGAKGESIPEFARILHVADVLDALTTRKKYKEAYVVADVMDFLMGGADILFDREVVEAALDCFEPYPIGITVELSNGEYAVIAGHNEDRWRPVILIENDEEHRRIDLATDPEYRSIMIRSGALMRKIARDEVEHLRKIRTTEPKRTSLSDLKAAMTKVSDPDEKAVQNGLPFQTIVVVDDMKVNLKVVSSALRDTYAISSYQSGEACLNHMRRYGAPDLLLMDVEMPGMDGIETVRKLREEGYDTMPVIFLTGASDRRTVMNCMSVGAVDYILKPIKPAYLIERVKDAIEKRI